MLETSFIVAFAVMFIHASFWEGMIFGKVAEAMHSWPDWIKKPLYDCPICMSFWHGLWIIAALQATGYVNYCNPLPVLLTLFAAGGINTVLIYIISYAKDRPDSED